MRNLATALYLIGTELDMQEELVSLLVCCFQDIVFNNIHFGQFHSFPSCVNNVDQAPLGTAKVKFINETLGFVNMRS